MDSIEIKNFKCIKDFSLQLDRITVLTGVNSSGKSSVVQALLLLKKVFDITSESPTKSSFEIPCSSFFNVPNFDSVVRIGADFVEISGGPVSFEVIPEDRETVAVRRMIKEGEHIPGWLSSKDFVYLYAERMGPRWESDLIDNTDKYSGINGKYSASRLYEAMNTPKVEGDRLCPESSTDNYQIQVDKWMTYIFGDVSLKAERLSDKYAQIKVRQPMGWFAASSVGFGYVYALPIVLDGLRIPSGSMMIVENPEAHLHPKAQSNMGYFLGTLAAAGVRVVVETHSEHVVNGIRRAAVSGIGLNPDEMKIYFFGEKTSDLKPLLITMDDEGELSDFPEDFFDQVRQDMKEIWRLIQNRQN
ncbi:MAG: DUF3696 domain-containing protein [Muribaculaceae bacterium]|nr:DUF3696 domain-containing protein [Muribaculaceae bacterium]